MTSWTMERVDSPDLSDAYPTIAMRVRRWAQTDPDQVVMRDKDFGIWQERTWAQLWEQVLTVAHGLVALVFRKGYIVSIQSEDRPEWIILVLSTVSIRCISTGLYSSIPPAYVSYFLNYSGSSFHFS